MSKTGEFLAAGLSRVEGRDSVVQSIKAGATAQPSASGPGAPRPS